MSSIVLLRGINPESNLIRDLLTVEELQAVFSLIKSSLPFFFEISPRDQTKAPIEHPNSDFVIEMLLQSSYYIVTQRAKIEVQTKEWLNDDVNYDKHQEKTRYFQSLKNLATRLSVAPSFNYGYDVVFLRKKSQKSPTINENSRRALEDITNISRPNRRSRNKSGVRSSAESVVIIEASRRGTPRELLFHQMIEPLKNLHQIDNIHLEVRKILSSNLRYVNHDSPVHRLNAGHSTYSIIDTGNLTQKFFVSTKELNQIINNTYKHHNNYFNISFINGGHLVNVLPATPSQSENTLNVFRDVRDANLPNTATDTNQISQQFSQINRQSDEDFRSEQLFEFEEDTERVPYPNANIEQRVRNDDSDSSERLDVAPGAYNYANSAYRILRYIKKFVTELSRNKFSIVCIEKIHHYTRSTSTQEQTNHDINKLSMLSLTTNLPMFKTSRKRHQLKSFFTALRVKKRFKDDILSFEEKEIQSIKSIHGSSDWLPLMHQEIDFYGNIKEVHADADPGGETNLPSMLDNNIAHDSIHTDDRIRSSIRSYHNGDHTSSGDSLGFQDQQADSFDAGEHLNLNQKERDHIISALFTRNRHICTNFQKLFEELISEGKGLIKRTYICTNCFNGISDDAEKISRDDSSHIWICPSCENPNSFVKLGNTYSTNEVNEDSNINSPIYFDYVSPRLLFSALFSNYQYAKSINENYNSYFNTSSHQTETTDSSSTASEFVSYSNSQLVEKLKRTKIKTTHSELGNFESSDRCYYEKDNIRLSVRLYSDGVAVDGKCSIIPFALKISELGNNFESSQLIRLVAIPSFTKVSLNRDPSSLNVGNSHPNDLQFISDKFLQLITNDFCFMSSSGFSCYDSFQEKVKTVFASLISFNGDYVGVSRMLNLNGQGGISPCFYCCLLKDHVDPNLENVDLELNNLLETKGQEILENTFQMERFLNERGKQKQRGGSVITRNNYNVPRKDQLFLKRAEKLLQNLPNSNSILGLSNISWFFKHDSSISIQGLNAISIDSMHLLENVAKKLRFKFNECLGGNVALNIITFPSIMGEFPLNYSRNIKNSCVVDLQDTHMKAEMELSMAIIIPIIVFHISAAGTDIDNNDQLLSNKTTEIFKLHFILLHITNSYYVDSAKLDYYDEVIKLFVRTYEEEYVMKAGSEIPVSSKIPMNSVYLHMLTHVVQQTRFKGPINLNNGFGLERFMGSIKGENNSTFKTITAVSNKSVVLHNIMSIIEETLCGTINRSKNQVADFKQVMEKLLAQAVAAETSNLNDDESYIKKMGDLRSVIEDNDQEIVELTATGKANLILIKENQRIGTKYKRIRDIPIEPNLKTILRNYTTRKYTNYSYDSFMFLKSFELKSRLFHNYSENIAAESSYFRYVKDSSTGKYTKVIERIKEINPLKVRKNNSICLIKESLDSPAGMNNTIDPTSTAFNFKKTRIGVLLEIIEFEMNANSTRRNLNTHLPETLKIAVGRFLVIDNLEEVSHDGFNLCFRKQLKEVIDKTKNKIELVNLTNILALVGQMVVKKDLTEFHKDDDLADVVDGDFVYWFMKENCLNFDKFFRGHNLTRV